MTCCVAILLILTFGARHIYSARILGVFPIPSLSHQIVYRELTKELARRGHEVVVITPDPARDPTISPKLYKEIDVHDVAYDEWKKGFNFAGERQQSDDPVTVYPLFKQVLMKIVDSVSQSSFEIQNILYNDTRQFDLLLVESYARVAFGFAAKFKVPYIGVVSCTGFVSHFDAVGSPTHPVLYPDLFRQRIGQLSIWDRFKAVYNDIYMRYYDYVYDGMENEIVKKHFGQDAPALSSLENNMDMLFLNVHPILAGIRPITPSVIYMGGLHLRPKRTLPEDLKSYLDGSTQGVIYMSLGSNVMSKDLPPEKLQVFTEAFRGLKFNVLWKFENEELKGKPDNVKISKWLPQQDLLGHPNVKAFITQGGQQSMDEAIRDGVPFIGIPFIGDQDLNVQRMVQFQIGVGLQIHTLTSEKLREAIEEVTGNLKYKENIEKLRDLLADQPMTPLDRAVWWVEHVIRHKGARHLRSPSADATLVEYFMLDVLAVILVSCIAFVTTVLGLLYLLYICTIKRVIKYKPD